MKNKAFTLIELLVIIAIVAIIGGMVIPFISNFAKIGFYTFVYFCIPTIILGVSLKLNMKYKWIVKKRYNDIYNREYYTYKMYNDYTFKNDTMRTNILVFFSMWPIYLPSILIFFVLRKIKNKLSIPEET